MLWTNQQVETAMRILGRYSRVCDALPEIEKSVNRKVTVNQLSKAMKRRGADAPSYYLQRDLVGKRIVYNVEPTKADNEIINEYFRKTENAWIRNVDQGHENVNFKTAQVFIDGKPVGPVTHIPVNINDCEFSGPYRAPNVEEVVVGEKILKLMVCPDVHVPFEDKVAWATFLKACEVVKPDVLVIIGDFADVLSLSSHQKSPKDNTNFKSELASVNAALDKICALKINRVVFCSGNHCHRIDRFIESKAPELDGMMNVYDLFKMKERGFEYVPYGEFIRIGEMAFCHDVGRAGMHAAKESLAAFQGNLCFGHSHRAQVFYGGTVEGKTHVCMNVGWLGDYEAISYTNRAIAKKDWTHSFGFIYQTEDGVSFCNLIPIINGRCVVDGKLVDVNA